MCGVFSADIDGYTTGFLFTLDKATNQHHRWDKLFCLLVFF
jgi:hypothetical protein